MRVNEEGYIVRRCICHNVSNSKINIYKPHRDWWLVKYHNNGSAGTVNLSNVYLPKKYIGKKVRFKIEIIDEKEE